VLSGVTLVIIFILAISVFDTSASVTGQTLFALRAFRRRFLGHHASYKRSNRPEHNRPAPFHDKPREQGDVMKPVHPMVVHFPIALLALSVTADLTAFVRHSDSLRNTGWWALVGAAVGAATAAPAGLYDMRRADLEAEVHERVHRHMKVGLALLAAILAMTLWRGRIYMRPEGAISATYLDFALLTMATRNPQC